MHYRRCSFLKQTLICLPFILIFVFLPTLHLYNAKETIPISSIPTSPSDKSNLKSRPVATTASPQSVKGVVQEVAEEVIKNRTLIPKKNHSKPVVPSTTTWHPVWTSNDTKHQVLILSPISNVQQHLENLFRIFNSLSYPHDLISIGLGEDSSTDGTLELARRLRDKYSSNFQRIGVFELHQFISKDDSWAAKHQFNNQLSRRSHLAKARNRLLLNTITDHIDYVFWMDADVKTVPADIVQILIGSGKDIVVPACYFTPALEPERPYDLNTWQETPDSLAELDRLPPNQLVVEGYSASKRLLPGQLIAAGQPLVQVDGVGGCVLLVRADLHRNGLVFPPFVFQHHIETEGLAKMAASMGYKSYFMTKVKVYHS